MIYNDYLNESYLLIEIQYESNLILNEINFAIDDKANNKKIQIRRYDEFVDKAITVLKLIWNKFNELLNKVIENIKCNKKVLDKLKNVKKYNNVNINNYITIKWNDKIKSPTEVIDNIINIHLNNIYNKNDYQNIIDFEIFNSERLSENFNKNMYNKEDTVLNADIVNNAIKILEDSNLYKLKSDGIKSIDKLKKVIMNNNHDFINDYVGPHYLDTNEKMNAETNAVISKISQSTKLLRYAILYNNLYIKAKQTEIKQSNNIIRTAIHNIATPDSESIKMGYTQLLLTTTA